MRLETLPIILGVLVGAAGFALIADSVIRDGTFIAAERRREARAERSLWGEALIGAGLIAIAIALVSGDSWRYTTIAILSALILCAAGVALNWRYVRAMSVGARAAAPTDPDTTPDANGTEPEPRLRAR